MPFLIRVFDRVGTIGWVVARDERGVRTFGSRLDAEVFEDIESALAAIKGLPMSITTLKFDYSIEPLNERKAAGKV
jgi:hypothetical protein